MSQMVSVAAIVVPAGIALIIAYQHRKQMRQIEAHRSDPSVPLKPPPSPLWRWFKKYSNFFLMLIPLADLYRHSHSHVPVTVDVVIDISLQVGLLLFLTVMAIFERLLDYISASTEVISGIILSLHRITDQLPKQS